MYTKVLNPSKWGCEGLLEDSFYPVEMAKQITEDIIDKKIIQHLVYPEKATRRGIEGEIIIKVKNNVLWVHQFQQMHPTGSACAGQMADGKALYLPLNHALNLKLL